LSNILKSSEVIIDSKKYVLTRKIDPLEEKNDEKDESDQDISKEMKQELNQMKKDILEDAKKESDEILKNAKIENEQIISEAYDESMKIREKAKKEGFEIGKKEGLAVMKDKEKKLMAEALQYKNKIIDEYDAYLESKDESIVNLVIDTVEKILNKHVDEDLDLIQNLVKKGIEKSIFTENIKIRVSEDDYEVAVDSKAKILTFSKDIKDIEFVTDYSLEKGDCIIESQNGSVDVSVSTQYGKFKEFIQELIKD
jgi:flagellar assembly protein FliH